MDFSVPPLRQALREVAEEQEAEAEAMERAAQSDPDKARDLRSSAAHRRRLAERARGLARGLY